MSKAIPNTVIVAIDIENIDNFNCLPERFTIKTMKKPVEVIVHHNPRFNFSGDRLVKNYDILITDSVVTPDIDACIIKRHAKSEQMIRLNRIIEDCEWDKSNLIVPKTFFCSRSAMDSKVKSYNYVKQDLINGKRYLIKPEHGARSIGQITFTAGEVNLEDVIALTQRHDLTQFSEMLQEINSKCDERDKVISDIDDEGLAMLKNQGWLIQEYLDNIAGEYRAIVSNGSIISMQKRGIHTTPSGLKHAKYSSKIQLRADDFYSNYKTPFDLFAQSIDLKFGSIDFFHTDDHRVGVFEYCNQFGIASYEVDELFAIHTRFIKELILQRYTLWKPN